MVTVVVTVFVDDEEEGWRVLSAAFGVMTCRVGDRDGVGRDETGDSFFNGENRSRSSKFNGSISFEMHGTGVAGFRGDFVSIFVR